VVALASEGSRPVPTGVTLLKLEPSAQMPRQNTMCWSNFRYLLALLRQVGNNC